MILVCVRPYTKRSKIQNHDNANYQAKVIFRSYAPTLRNILRNRNTPEHNEQGPAPSAGVPVEVRWAEPMAAPWCGLGERV